ncbi:hypothetical protein pb186bvf_002550 [Paramecium bursaria]
MDEKYESIIKIIRDKQNQQQYDVQVNRLPFFAFYRMALMTDQFVKHSQKFVKLIQMKKGQYYKTEFETVDSVFIILQGQMNLLQGVVSPRKKMLKQIGSLLPGDTLFQDQIYLEEKKSPYAVQCTTDCLGIELEIFQIHMVSDHIIKKLAVKDFQFNRYKDLIEFFKSQFPDAQIIELIPIIKRVQLKSFLQNSIIYQKDQDIYYLYFILDGEINLYFGRQMVTTLCERDSFGEESLLQGTYNYTAKTHQYKPTNVLQLQVDQLNEFSPNIVRLLQEKYQKREQCIREIKKSKSIHEKKTKTTDVDLLKPFLQYLHIAPVKESPRILTRIGRASSMQKSGQFNFMVLNNPGKNITRLFKKQISRQLVKDLASVSEFEEEEKLPRPYKSYELTKFWNLLQLPSVRK